MGHSGSPRGMEGNRRPKLQISAPHTEPRGVDLLDLRDTSHGVCLPPRPVTSEGERRCVHKTVDVRTLRRESNDNPWWVWDPSLPGALRSHRGVGHQGIRNHFGTGTTLGVGNRRKDETGSSPRQTGGDTPFRERAWEVVPVRTTRDVTGLPERMARLEVSRGDRHPED